MKLPDFSWERLFILDKIEKRRQWAKVCESPIEIDLAVAMDSELGALFDRHELKMVAQYAWHQFRIDFAIVRRSVPLLFIECDGAEFHSTKEQLARDRRKDAAALQSGIPLLRFTGSEIYRVVDGCVGRVLNYLVRDRWV
jgi:very-short-patch-repair endonuclease